MALSLIGILCVDPETESMRIDPLLGERWLVVKELNADYRALEIDTTDTFYGKVQHVLEDDLLEGYMPDQAFFNAHYAEPLERLSLQIKHGQQLSPDLQPVAAALCALLKNRSYDPDLVPGSADLPQILAMFKDFYPGNPGFGFVYSLASAAIRHRKNLNYDQAVFYYMKAMDIGGEDPNILFNLARVYHELGAEDRAISSLKRALALNPKMKMARQFLDFLTIK